MKDLNNECCQDNCNEPATHLVYWPGEVPKKMCEPHSKKAIAVAMAMGMYLHVEEKNFAETKENN